MSPHPARPRRNPSPTPTNSISNISLSSSISSGNGFGSKIPSKVVEIPQVNSFFAYDILVSSDIPPEVDVTQKEAYLSPTEFQCVMGVEKQFFYALPKWQRDKKKREVDLF